MNGPLVGIWMVSAQATYPWVDTSKGFVWCPGAPQKALFSSVLMFSHQLVLMAVVGWTVSEGYTQGACDVAEALVCLSVKVHQV